MFWGGNYYTLAPEESVTVSVDARVPADGLHVPVMTCEGWNTRKINISLSLRPCKRDMMPAERS